MFSHLTRCWETPKGSDLGNGSRSEVVEQQEGTASLLGIANVASTIFLKILLKTVVISAATFSSSFVCEFRFRFFFYCFNHFYFVRLPCHLLWLLPWSQGVQRSEESSRGPSEPFWFFSSDCVVFICFLCSSEQCFKFELITWQGSGIGFRGTRILAYNNTNHNLSIGYDALPIRKRG